MEEVKTQKKKFNGLLTVFHLRNRKNLLVFSIFVMLSFLFWFLIALSKEYTTIIEYPVRYTSFPEDKVLVNELPDEIQLQITGYGFDLLKYEFTEFLFPYLIDFQKVSKNSTLNNYNLNVVDIINDVRRKFPSVVKIKEIQPLSIRFVFSSVAEKKLHVVPNVKYQLAMQYVIIDGVKVVPDQISVKGPQSILDTMKFVYTEEYDLKILDQPVKRKLNLKEIHSLIYSTPEVEMFLNVQKYTEGIVDVAVEMINLPDSLVVNFLSNTVSIKYKVPLYQFNNILPNQFKVVADYLSWTSDDTKILLFLKKKPKAVFDANIVPNKVSFLLSKKQITEN